MSWDELKDIDEKLTAKTIDKLLQSLTPTKRRREAKRKRHVKQQRKWGFCDAELWDLDQRIVTFILPRLIRFRKMPKMGYPASLSPKRWDKILDRMIVTFEIIKRGTDNKREAGQVRRGLQLFAKHFMDLWD